MISLVHEILSLKTTGCYYCFPCNLVSFHQFQFISKYDYVNNMFKLKHYHGILLLFIFLAQVIWAYRAKHDIVVRVCVCVSVNIDLWKNNSGTVCPINLKFCSLIVKAIV